MVDTLDLQDEIGSLGATNIEVPKPDPELSPPPKEPEKNIITDNSKVPKMDSTPINDIMMEQQPEMSPMMQPQMGAMPAQMPMMAPQQPVAAPQPPAAVPMKSKNIMNLTDEQMDAVVAALAAIAAFSAPAQERLGSFVPNFSDESGRSMTGMLVSGLLVAILYFFARRYVIKA
jgi:hypothetical protein